MSLSRKTYSPMSHTYSYSSTLTPSYSGTLTPSYSYSRVTTYLDALQKDETITKLKRQLNNVKSVEMKYHSLLQQISLAQKQNRLLQAKNNEIEHEYIQKIQGTTAEVSQLQHQFIQISQRLANQQKNVDQAEKQVQMLLQELKKLKLQQQTIQQQNLQLQKQVSKCNSMFQQLTQHKKQIAQKKTTLHQDSKTTSSQMESSLKRLTELTAMIQKYEQQLDLLQKESQRFSLESQNIEGIITKNNALMQNLQRKVRIHEGQNEQLKNQLNQMIQNYNKIQKQSQSDKQSLYENIIRVEQQSLLLRNTLNQLDKILQADSTQKKYLRDISTKHGTLTGQNERLREMLGLLQINYNQKKVQQTGLIEQINKKIRVDQAIKQGLQLRNKELTKLKQKMLNC